MWFVYVLMNKEERMYIGISESPERRLREHNFGRTKSTKGFTPWKIVFKEACNNRREARDREKYWKSGFGRERLNEILFPPL